MIKIRIPADEPIVTTVRYLARLGLSLRSGPGGLYVVRAEDAEYGHVPAPTLVEGASQ